MRLEDLSYTLGPENIAGEPREVRLGARDRSRMLVVDRSTGDITHSRVLDLPRWLSTGDVVVLNDSKRLPGVLKTHSVAGAQIEFRLTELTGARTCIARPYPTHFVVPGLRVSTVNGGALTIMETGLGPHGLCTLESDEELVPLLKQDGLPITSFFYRSYWDIDHYNPIYAGEEGSLESPMAGLHFSEALVETLEASGVHVARITLHVVGSWLPFIDGDLEHHQAQPERYIIPEETARKIDDAKRNGKRVVAVGSTSMRTLESAVLPDGRVPAGDGVSTLFLKPGSEFRAVDAYFTNFHPAQSSLMVLDAAFCPLELLLRAYGEAQRAGYLFQEFGDAVLYV